MPPSTQKRARKQEVSAPEPAGTVEALHRPRKRRDQEVIDAAAKVFYERGFADASVQDVADELGILKGSLYHYIETK
jgi:TetR/AcrR family transcriptional regulator, cholesterol catabolism regulator